MSLKEMVGIFLLVASGLGAEPASDLARLHARVKVEVLSQMTEPQLTGHYVPPMDGLSGNDLYLLSDGSYLYCEWADIEPVTIHDKGTWRVIEGVLHFTSDADVVWCSGLELDRQHAVVRRPGHKREVLLIGMQEDLGWLEGESNPVSWLNHLGRQQEERFTAEKERELKAELLQRAWRPAYFTRRPPCIR
jgi:hypothetical protein